eukprot:CAMPEP_0181313098 /NCGR_PEP_ID=MMETSP1101-20121128/14065_1 /TAXON_ID=46948 /ORGANISM="Rhodomonas abbreviata, Strain Caron Lab Isolate" /LENGTH=355 /DNA_ID=CAMNT_0023420025 /DNA_START=218 /DNA_END=1282 /DNA_ORIENTATION=+
MAESLKDHIKRRAGVIAERVELELTVAGTEYAPMERAVFKATKNNTKIPKEKHVTSLHRSIADQAFAKTVLKMLARRLKEVGAAQVSASNIAAGMKTLAVWHRCLNAGDNSFLSLCSHYAHVLEPPAGNALGQMYAGYLREMLSSFAIIKHPYHRESSFEASKMTKLGEVEVLDHTPLVLLQLSKLLECDLQGGLIDSKTRNSVQYTINLLVIDAIPLFNALDLAMERVRDFIGSLDGNDAERLCGYYERYARMPEKLLTLLKQISFDKDAAPPVTSFDRATLKEFKTRVEGVQAKLRGEECSVETVKALVEVAKHTYSEMMSGVDEATKNCARIALEDLESSEGPSPAAAANPP